MIDAFSVGMFRNHDIPCARNMFYTLHLHGFMLVDSNLYMCDYVFSWCFYMLTHIFDVLYMLVYILYGPIQSNMWAYDAFGLMGFKGPMSPPLGPH
jgi:hypothetical protein